MNVNLRDIVSPLLICLVLTSGMKPRYSRVKTLLLMAGCTLLMIPCNLLQESAQISNLAHFMLYSLTVAAVAAFYGWLALHGSFRLKLAMSMVMSTAFVHVKTIFSIAISWITPEPLSPVLLELAVIALNAAAVFLLSRVMIRSNREIPDACWITLVLVAIAGMIPFQAAAAEGPGVGLLIALPLLILPCVVLWLCSSSVQYYEKNMVDISLESQDGLHTQYLKEQASFMREMRTIIHEKNHYLDSVASLLEMGEYERAKKLIMEIRRQPVPRHDSVHTGNIVVDAVINHGMTQARQQGIPFDAEAYADNSLPISDAEITSLLSNLISNALEASQQVTEPHIWLKIYPARGYLCISIKNRANKAALQSNPQLCTTKDNPRYHGIGLKVIETIAQRHGGLAEFDVGEDDVFSATVMLQIDQVA